MKIKNIFIKAFRLFGEQNVSFSNPEYPEKAANFVVIYAPNGFGKTSMFDALEFAMTKNIHRLKMDNFSENLKIDQKLSAISSFIHNKHMQDERVEVKIGFEEGDDMHMICSQEDELNCLKNEPVNLYFQNVILSQDWFSEFLATNNASERFRIFMNYFSDSRELLEYHANLRGLERSNSKQVKALERDIRELKRKINAKVDEHITEKISAAIQHLHEYGIGKNWSGTIKGKELDSLQIEAKNILNDLLTTIGNKSMLANNFNAVILGQNELPAIDMIPTYQKDAEAKTDKLKNIKEQLEQIIKLKSLEQQISYIDENKSKLNDTLQVLCYLIDNYDKYLSKQNALLQLKTLKESVIKKRENSDIQLADKNKEIETAQNTLYNLNEQKQGYESKIKNLHDKFENYIALENEDTELLKQIKKDENEKHQQQEFLTIAENRAISLSKLKTDAMKRMPVLIPDLYEAEVQQILDQQGLKLKKENELREIDESIEKQTKYKSEIEELVINSRKMISELGNSTCPLCGHDYVSHEALLQSIETNSIITNSIEEAIKQRDKTEEQIESLNHGISHAYNQLILKLNTETSTTNDKVKKYKETINILSNTITTANNKRNEITKLLNGTYKYLEGKTEDSLEKIYKASIDALIPKITEASVQIESLKQKISIINAEIKGTYITAENCQHEIGVIESNDFYIEYQTKSHRKSVTPNDLEEWKLNKNQNEIGLAENNAKSKAIHTNIKELKDKDVSPDKEPMLRQDIEQLNKDIANLKEQIAKTINFLISKCGLEGIDNHTDFDTIKALFNEKMATNKAELKKVKEQETTIKNYINLLELGALFNENEKNKQNLAAKEKEQENAISQKDMINTEQYNLEDYLNKYVQGFFKLGLINKLYNIIDPHPEYKEIKFECEFTTKDPKLNVLMHSKTDDKDAIVPNLYFSTAQINILSFCIFLAKALFAKTDKHKNLECIFIDDPIQALDDINILSMIDLLRNVAFSLDRQIVLTTHDKNFFELLKKKIPDNLFNSRFLQLKERGVFAEG